MFVCTCMCIWFFFLSLFELSFALCDPDHGVIRYHLINARKKARDVSLAFPCHLSNIMPDSIFWDSILYGITCLFVCYWCFFKLFLSICFCFFQGVVTTAFFRLEEMDGVFCHYRTSGMSKTFVSGEID